MDALIWGILLRLVQSALHAAPFIFTGLCIMGILHRLLGQVATKRVFGSNSVQSLVQAWVIGMLLPGCSLGVIPIVKQLRRSGIAIGTIFAFALSSPLFDPLSLLYGLTLSNPLTLVAFAACSLAVVTVTGALFDRMFPDTEIDLPEPPPTPYGVRRVLAILAVMARESVSDSALYVAAGLAGVGLLSAVLPSGSLQSTMAHDNPSSPLLMTAVAIPAYATPMMAMSQLGSMFQHGNSIGAAFILLVFGAGMNLGLFVWMTRHYGWGKSVLWMGLMIAVVLVLSYGIERPLLPRDIEPADHTHAFDSYCQPFRYDSRPADGFAAEIWRQTNRQARENPHELVGAIALLSLMMLGILLKLVDRFWVVETWLNRPSAAAESAGGPAWDVVLPAPVLGLVALLAILAGSLVGCYAYYPAPQEALDELQLASTEALSAALSGNRQHALHWIPLCDNWLRRLEVGHFLRFGRLGEPREKLSRQSRDEFERLKHLLEENSSPQDIRRQVNQTSQILRSLRSAFP